VRERELGGRTGFVREEEKVEIERARAPADLAHARSAGGELKSAQDGEEILGMESGLDAEDEVEKRRLVGEADGGRLVNRGGLDSEDAGRGTERGDGGADGGSAVTQVGADADKGLAGGRKHEAGS
jgi:hypothetical protein